MDESDNPTRDSKPRLKLLNPLQQVVDCDAPAIQMMDHFTRIPGGNVRHGVTDSVRKDEVLK